MQPVFIITIDTEGDNLWANPQTITTENAAFLPRFQALCEQYSFKPTYLVNYEMVLDERFQVFGRAVLEKQTGEIGLHIHPWNSPPIDHPPNGQIYLFELSDAIMEAKIDFLHNLLKQTFGVDPVSHRAGRWGFDGRVARTLARRRYLVDCSVTPGVSWERYRGDPNCSGGSDFTDFPYNPYFMDMNDISQSGQSPMLQVPMTIRPRFNSRILSIYRKIKDARLYSLMERFVAAPYNWLRPNGRNLDRMTSLVDQVLAEGAPVIEFMLHSSELMPGGSPIFATERQIEVLYNHLEALFEHIASLGAVGMTLAEYRMSGEVLCVS